MTIKLSVRRLTNPASTVTGAELVEFTQGGVTVVGTIDEIKNYIAGEIGGDTLISEGALIASATAKATPVDADFFGLMDSAASNVLKKLSWLNVKATLKTYFDTLYQARSPSIQAVTSSATVTPTFADDMVKITAQAAGLTLANPTGTAIPGLGIVIRIKDNGTARAISYDTQYRALGVTLPTTTVISKTLYLACIWNSDDTKLDVVAVGQEA